MKFRHLRKIVQVKQFLNSEKVSNTIVFGILSVILAKEAVKQSAEENTELIVVLTFTIVLALSMGLTLRLTYALFGFKSEPSKNEEKSKFWTTNKVMLLGFISAIVLGIMTDFKMFNLRAIGAGIVIGFGWGLMSLFGKGVTKVWEGWKENEQQKQFNKLNDRPENRRRNEKRATTKHKAP